MKRRDFLKTAGFFPGVLLTAKAGIIIPDADEEICRKKFVLAVSLLLKEKPVGEAVAQIGKSFLGTDYFAHALEVPGKERLVVNMRGLDCVSFYENALVLARCVKKNKMTFDDYKKELQWIRYRGGVIEGYPSRLHYTSDYFHDNEQRHVWKNMSRELGGVQYRKEINFMSTHPESYRQLKEDPSLVGVIRKQEEEIMKRETFYVPKADVASIEGKLQDGDILGITTDIEGLDTSHTGIVIRVDGTLRFMHAPITGKKVEITDVTLADYLARNKRQTGIMAVRPNEP